MEEITMERLLTDMRGVIEQFNQLVERRDIAGARAALSQVENLVATANGVELDQLEDPSMDHVLHQLLSNIRGVIEIGESQIEISGERYLTNEELQRRIEEKEKELERADSDYARITEEINELRSHLVPDSEYSTMVVYDENLRALEQERANIIRELANIDRQLAELEARGGRTDGSGTRTTGEGASDTRRREIESQIADIDSQIAELEDQIDTRTALEIQSSINERIQSLRDQIVRNNEGLRNVVTEDGREAVYAQNAELQAQIDELTALYEALIPNNQIADIDRQITELRDQIVRNNEGLRNVATEDGREAVYAQNAELQAQISDLEAQRRTLTNRTPQNIIADIDRQITELRDQIVRNNEGLRNVATEDGREAVYAQNAELQAQIDELNARKEVLGREGSEFRDTDIQSRIDELNRQKKVLKEELSSLAQEQGDEVQVVRKDEIRSKIQAYEIGLDSKREERIAELSARILAILEEHGAVDENGREVVIAWEGQLVDENYPELVEQVAEMRREIRELAAQRGNSVSQRGQDVLPVLRELEKLENVPGLNFDAVLASEIDSRIAEYERQLQEIANNPYKDISDEDLQLAYNTMSEEYNFRAHQENGMEEHEDDDYAARFAALSAEIDRRRENPNLDYLREQERLENIISELRGLQKERTRTQIHQRGNGENDAEKVELEARKRQLEARKAELDRQIENYPGRVTRTVTRDGDRLDLGEEAARIGDHIFKTAEIRRELADRQVSREEFLEFYRSGIEMAQRNLEELNNAAKEITDEITTLFVDENSDKTLIDQEKDARDANDDAALIAVYEQMRKRFKETGKYDEQLGKLGLLDREITTKEDAENFATFYNNYMRLSQEQLTTIRNQASEQRENIEIFRNEIEIIQEEQRSIDIASGDLSSLQEESEREKALRARQIKATMTGDDPELQQEWNERFQRFFARKKTVRGTYTDRDGNVREVEYETVEPYPEMEEDAMFLNLSDYKKNLETSTKYRNSGNDPYAIGLGRKFDEAEARREGTGRDTVERMIGEMEDYTATFHGLTNEHAIKYANYRTAGSTLKAMKPVKGDLPATTKIGNGISNTFRFFGIRAPKFSRVNENGETVRDIRGGVLTLLADAAIVGGVAATGIVAGPLGLATWGVGYAARGAVTAGNVIAARNYRRKHAYEIENNIPTPFSTTKDAREVARKDYYRDVEGMGRFTSWVKAKSDRLPFFRRRAEETEERIIADRTELSNRTIDARDDLAIQAAEANLEAAERNQHRRQSNYEKVARSSNTYNDIVRDPDSVDMDQTTAQVARNAAVESRRGRAQDVNPESTVERKERYVKDPEELEKTERLKQVKTVGGTIAATAVTEEEHYTGRQQKQDRINKVLTIALTMLGKVGIDFVRDGLTKEIQGPDKEVTRKESITEKRPITEERPIYEERTTTELDPSKTLGQYSTDGIGLNDVYGGPGTPTSITQGGDIDGMVLAVKGPDGKTIEVSVSEAGSFIRAGRHVHTEISGELSNMTMEQAISTLRTNDPINFQKYIEAAGLPQNATDVQVAQHALENGEFYTQVGANGWQQVGADNLLPKVEKVLTGWKDEIVDYEDVVTGWRDVTTTVPGDSVTVFSPEALVHSAAEGAVVGGVVAGADQLHEAAHQTKKLDPGTYEEKNPRNIISRIARAEQERINREREEQAEEEEVENSGREDNGGR